MHNWRFFVSQATRMRNFERSATLVPSSPTLRKIPRAPRLAHNLLLCRLRRSKHRNELRISHDHRLLQFWEKKNKNSPLSNFFPEFILIYFPDFFPVWKTGSPVSRRFQESKVAFDWKIWMHILKSGLWICNRTRKTDFTSEKSVLKVDLNYEIQIRIFCISFFTACLGNPKKRICKTVSWTVVFFLL